MASWVRTVVESHLHGRRRQPASEEVAAAVAYDLYPSCTIWQQRETSLNQRQIL
jgi:hypothetical protein